MKRLQAYFFVLVNAGAAFTIFLYYILRTDNLIFNVLGIFWYILMYGNMILCLKTENHQLLKQIMYISPVIIMLMAGNESYLFTMTQGASLVIPLLAIAYYITAAYFSYLLTLEKNKPNQVPLISRTRLCIYGLYYLFVLFLAIFNLYYLVIASVLKMNSPIAYMQLLYNALPLWVAVTSIGLWRRLRSSLGRGMVITASIATIFGFMIPILSLSNAWKNADEAYRSIYGGEEVAVHFSVPKMVFGYSEYEYNVTKDVEYHSFLYNNNRYTLKYDVYRPADSKNDMPVIIRLHGSGGSKGFMNNISESAVLATHGYAVFDLNYGNEECKPSNEILADNVCAFLDYLGTHADELGVNKDRVFVSGGSRGGKITLMTAVRWSHNALSDIRHKVTLRGIILQYAFMTDVFSRTGNERIVAIEDLRDDLPPILAINVTNDGSVQGGHLMQGVLKTKEVDMCNIELRFGVHGADIRTYSGWGQMNTAYFLRFVEDALFIQHHTKLLPNR